MHVSDIMTSDPVCATIDTSLDDATALMEKHDVRHLPVLEGRYLAGVLSDRDILEATGCLPGRVHDCRGPGVRDKISKTAGEIARRGVYTVAPNQSALSAFVDMFGHSIGCLPVVDDRVLVGIVTETDALRMVYEHCRAGDWNNLTVADKMTQQPRTVQVGVTLEEVRGALDTVPIRHLPVVQNEALVGIVSDRDLRRAVGVGRSLDLSVDEVMSREVVDISPDRALSRAAEIMLEGKLSCLPVVQEDRLVGILTVTDLLDYCVQVLGSPREARADSPSAAE